MLGVFAPTGNIIFRDPATNANYLTTDAAARTTTIPSGATLDVDGAFGCSGGMLVTGPTTFNLGGVTFGSGGAVSFQGSTIFGAGSTIDATNAASVDFGTVTIANLHDVRDGTFSLNLVYGNGSRTYAKTIGSSTVECFEISFTYGETIDNVPFIHVVPAGTSQDLAYVRGCFVKNSSDTGATVTIMLEGAIPQPTVFRWIACAI
jgi:hypothetical protein